MIDSTPTANAAKIQRDGRLVIRVAKLIARLELPDLIQIEPGRPTLLAGNHRSLFDVFCSAAAVANANTSCRFLVQARYFESRLAGRWLRRIGCIPLSRETRDAAFAEATAALARGELVAIMPEGRLIGPRDRDPQTGHFRTGFSELAAEAGARVRPIVFHGTDTAWPRGGWPQFRLRGRPRVTLRLGDTLELPFDDHRQNADYLMAIMTKMLDDLDANATI